MAYHGSHLSNTEIMRHLDLPVADVLLDRLEAEARPRWEGQYRLETPRRATSGSSRSR